MPTLTIWGDRDAFTQRREQELLTAGVAGSRLVINSGAAHSPHWEEPVRFAADLSAFILGQIPV